MNEIKKTEDRLLKVEDVAQMLSIKPVTVYQWYKQGAYSDSNLPVIPIQTCR